MKTKKYKDLTSNMKRSVLLKYFKDPIGSLIKLKYSNRNEEHLAIEIWTGESNLLVLVEPRILSSLNWDAHPIDDEDDDFYGDFTDELSDDQTDNFYA